MADEKKKIVYIEDEPDMIALAESILGRKKFEVTGAVGGRKGLETVRRIKPDLVLLDLIMPDLDGAQVLEAMRKTDLKDIPVILLTGTNFAEDLLIQHGSRIVINHPDGLYPAEVLDCLHAITNVLVPQPNP